MMITTQKTPQLMHFFSVIGICTSLLGGAKKPSTTPEPPSTKTSWVKKIPTQMELIKNRIDDYLRELPRNISDNFNALMNLDDFELMKYEAEVNHRSFFKVFDFAKERRPPSQEWSLPFANHGEELKKIVQDEFGLCAGLTSFHRKMNMLAIYDPLNQRLQRVPDRTTSPKAWLSFMKRRIDAIADLKMAVIPGYKNLYEFSTDPEIEAYLAKKVVKEWEVVNVNFFNGFIQGMAKAKATRLSPRRALRIHRMLSERSALGYNPLIYLVKHKDQILTESHWIHTLQVTHVSPIAPDGHYEISVWDINYLEPEEANQMVIVKANGEIKYGDHVIGNIAPLMWDDLEVSRMIKNKIGLE